MILSNILITTLLTIIVLKILHWCYKRKQFLKQIANIPGPKGYPFIGNVLDFTSIENLIPMLMNYQKTYGLTFKLQLGPENYVFTSDPKLIECISTSASQIKKSATYRYVSNWLGDGLITANNPRWKKHRRLITPTFHFNILKDFVPVFHRNAHSLVTHLNECIGNLKQKEIDVYEDFVACTLDIICETAMGITINALRDGKRSAYLQSIKIMGKIVVERTYSFWKQIDFLYNLSPSAKLEKSSTKFVKQTSEEVIRRRRQEFQNNINVSGDKLNGDKEDVNIKKRIAFLDHLMATTQENGASFTDEELREEVDTFIFAGHDTTSSAMGFIFYLLATHPEVQEKVYEEVRQMSGKNYDDLMQLKYMEMVIKESLRMYPIVSIYARQLTKDVVFNGQTFPKDLNLAVFAYGTHRNEQMYPEAGKFYPERFMSENASERHTFTFVPFSAGLRNCIGQKFAMLEMKCLLSELVKAFKFAKSPDWDMVIYPEGTLKSANGIHLLVEKR